MYNDKVQVKGDENSSIEKLLEIDVSVFQDLKIVYTYTIY